MIFCNYLKILLTIKNKIWNKDFQRRNSNGGRDVEFITTALAGISDRGVRFGRVYDFGVRVRRFVF